MVKIKSCSVKNCHFHVGWVWSDPMPSPKSMLSPILFQSHYSFGKYCLICHDISKISAKNIHCLLLIIDNRVAMHEARLTLKSSVTDLAVTDLTGWSFLWVSVEYLCDQLENE